jgi:multicomponent Na+:H+ antiporter subunit C
MEVHVLYLLLSVLVFPLALYGFLFHADLIRKVVCVNVMGSSVFLFFIAVAYRDRSPYPDPVPHAMVLTGIVVAVSLTAFALALIRKYHRSSGSTALLKEGDEP